MIIIADMVRKLIEARASARVIAIAVDAVEACRVEFEAAVAALKEADENRRSASRARSQKYRDGHASVTSASRDANVTATVASRDDHAQKEISPAPLLEKTLPCFPSLLKASSEEIQQVKEVLVDGNERRSAEKWPSGCFLQFWAKYPHKVGKTAALRAFVAAQRTGVMFETLMLALDRYIAEKPADRPWCNPATWLNQGRWDDEPAALILQNGGYRNGPQSTIAGSAGDAARRIGAAITRGLDHGSYQPDHGLLPPGRVRES